MKTDNFDFVYIIKPNEKGTELKYSLRSIAKNYPNNRIWIVGYKPDWVQNVNYLPVEQCQTKWKNSTHNVIEACKCPDISNDFILMNDDFFCINPNIPLEHIITATLGTIDEVMNRYKRQKNEWADGFKQMKELLIKLNMEEPLLCYEAHLPLLINKSKFLEVINLPEVQEFMQTSKVLHKRTLYGNYVKYKPKLTLNLDTKVTKRKDNSEKVLKVCGWLSTADDLINDYNFKNLNKIIKNNLNESCKYENELTKAITEKPKLIRKKDKYF